MVELDDGLLAVEELVDEAEVAALHSPYALSQLAALQSSSLDSQQSFHLEFFPQTS